MVGNDAPRLWLHIGAPKTGTTFLQSFCTANRKRLLDQGVLYPLAGCENVAHHRLAWSVNPHGPAWSADMVFSALNAEIDIRRPRHTVISSEVFFIDTELERLAPFLADYDVRVIVYLRRQDVWFRAYIAQYVKENHYRLQSFKEQSEPLEIVKRHCDYAGVLDRWGQVVGHDRIVVRSYDRDKNEGNLLEGFLSLFDVEIGSDWVLPDDPGAVNRSLNSDELELVRLANGIETERQGRNRWLYQMQCIAGRRGGPEHAPYSFSASFDTRNLLATHASGNEEVARRYCDGQPLFTEVGDSEPTTSDTNQALALDSVAEIAALTYVEQESLLKALSYRLHVTRTVGMDGARSDGEGPLPLRVAVLTVDCHRSSNGAPLVTALSATVTTGRSQTAIFGAQPNSAVAAIAQDMGIGSLSSCGDLAGFLREAAGSRGGVLLVEDDVVLGLGVLGLAAAFDRNAKNLIARDHRQLGIWIPGAVCDVAAFILQQKRTTSDWDGYAVVSELSNWIGARTIVESDNCGIVPIEAVAAPADSNTAPLPPGKRTSEFQYARDLYEQVLKKSVADMLSAYPD